MGAVFPPGTDRISIWKHGKDSDMEIKDGKFIFTAEELKKLIDKISYRSYTEGFMDAGRQMKYAIEAENDETFQWDADTEDDGGRFFEEVG